MRRVGRDLDRVLVTLMVVLEDERRNFCLLHKTFRRATAEIYHAREPRARSDVGHVQYVLNDVKHEVIFLFKTSGRDSDRDAAVSNCGAENRHASFIG